MKFIIKVALIMILMPMHLVSQDMIDLELTKRIKKSKTINLIDNDFNGGSTTIIFGPSYGELVPNGGGTYTYTPDGTQDGPYQELITYEVCHQNDPTDCQFVDFRIFVEGDDGPEFFACEDYANFPAYTNPFSPDPNYVIDVLANDVEVNVSSLNIVLAPVNGSVLLQNNQVIYSPPLYFQGVDEFLYTVNSADGTQSDQIKVTIVVGNTNNLIPVRDCIYFESTLTVTEGDGLCYVIAVENLGPDDATGVEVYDQLPSGVSYVNNTPSQGFYSPNTSTWVIGNIPSNSMEELEICVNADVVGDFVNVAQVSAADQMDVDSNPNNDNGDQSEDDENIATITIQPLISDLELTLGPNITVTEGDGFCYTITVTNLGPENATGVEVSAPIPNGVSYVNDFTTTGSYSPTNATWFIGNIPLAASEELEICVDADVVGNYTAVAEVSAADILDIDSSPNNDNGDQSEDDEDNATIIIEPFMIDLELNYLVSNTTVIEGDQFCYTLEIENLGPDNATGVEVSAPIPNGVSYVNNNPSTGSYSPTSSTWVIGNIAVGGVEDLQICVDADVVGNYTNVAEVSAADQMDVDSNPNNDNGDQSEDDEDNASISIEPNIIDLSLSIGPNTTVTEGDGFCYTITVSNSGPVNATGVEVSAPIPNGVSYVNNNPSTGSYSPTSSTWVIGNIAVGGVEDLQICVDADVVGNYTNVAEVSAADQMDVDSNPNNDNGDQSEDDEDSASISIQQDIIDLGLTVGPNANVNVGDGFCYTITVVNSGLSEATGVEVFAPIPNGVSYVNNTPSTGSYSPASSTWIIGNIQTATIEDLEICVMATTGGSFTNVAEVSAADQMDVDSSPNNDDGDQSEDDEDSADITIVPDDILLTLRALLKGAYDSGTGLMRDDLRDNNLIPLEEPYSSDPNFNHNGSEQATSGAFNQGGPNAIVDWVLVELRSKNDPSVILYTRAALIERDGDIVDVDGDSAVAFAAPLDEYYVAIRHRNHLGVMTDQAVDLSNTTMLDFADPNQVTTWGTNAQFAEDANTMLMWSGNSNSDDRVIMQGGNNDTNPIFFEVLLAPTNPGNIANLIYQSYSTSDLNLDGDVIFQGANNDTNVIFFNVLTHPGNVNLLANFIINEQLP